MRERVVMTINHRPISGPREKVHARMLLNGHVYRFQFFRFLYIDYYSWKI